MIGKEEADGERYNKNGKKSFSEFMYPNRQKEKTSKQLKTLFFVLVYQKSKEGQFRFFLKKKKVFIDGKKKGKKGNLFIKYSF